MPLLVQGFSKKYQQAMNGISTVAITITDPEDVRGWSVSPAMFSTAGTKVLVGRNRTPTLADYDFVVSDFSSIFVEDATGSLSTMELLLVNAAGTTVPGSTNDYVSLVVYA